MIKKQKLEKKEESKAFKNEEDFNMLNPLDDCAVPDGLFDELEIWSHSSEEEIWIVHDLRQAKKSGVSLKFNDNTEGVIVDPH